LQGLERALGELRREISELRCEVGYWKSRHADAVRRNEQWAEELRQAKGEIRALRDERFGGGVGLTAGRITLLVRSAESPPRGCRLAGTRKCWRSTCGRIVAGFDGVGIERPVIAIFRGERYSGYKAMAQVKSGLMVLAFCWAHARRDFVRVGKSWSELTPWALGWLRRIREVYQIHRQRLRHRPSSAQFQVHDALLRQAGAAMFSLLATLARWKLNPRLWLTMRLEIGMQSGPASARNLGPPLVLRIADACPVATCRGRQRGFRTLVSARLLGQTDFASAFPAGQR